MKYILNREDSSSYKTVKAHILFGGNIQENYIYASFISRIDPNPN